MRIAVWHNLPSGGGKRTLWHHALGLSKRGHQVEAWCPPTANQNYAPLSSICPEHVVPLETSAEQRPSRYFGWLKDYLAVKRRLRAMDAHCRACARQIGQGGFDVLFANTCAWFAVSPIARQAQLPGVLYLQEPHRILYEAQPELPWAAPPVPPPPFLPGLSWARLCTSTVWLHGERIQVREEIANAKAFRRILVNSLFSRESVLRAYGLESSVCYLGVDTELFRPTGEPSEGYVVGLGAVGHSKGADRAIRALAAIAPALRPKLRWIGNGANACYLAALERQAKELGVMLEVKIMVSDHELVSLLSRAAVMLYTSRLEPFGLAPLEANACGVPVVAIAEGGVRETIEQGKNGFLVLDDNPQALAKAVTTVLGNAALAGEMRVRAREMVISRWGLDAAVARLEQALGEIAGLKGRD
jgi:glycosyltransferase involved in cell wall biosynthesis